MPRYEFHCVAEGVYGGPTPTDDLDEALLATASWVGSHWDIWDTAEGKYVQPIGSEEEEAEVRARVASRASHNCRVCGQRATTFSTMRGWLCIGHMLWRFCPECQTELIGPHEGDKWCPKCKGERFG